MNVHLGHTLCQVLDLQQYTKTSALGSAEERWPQTRRIIPSMPCGIKYFSEKQSQQAGDTESQGR